MPSRCLALATVAALSLPACRAALPPGATQPANATNGAASRPREDRTHEPVAPDAERSDTEPAAAVVSGALSRALADDGARRAARVFAECTKDGHLPSVELFGRGFGIWDHRRQFPFAPEQMSAALAEFGKARFAELAPTYGGRTRDGSSPEIDDDAAIRVLCRIRLELEGVRKDVVQFDKGEQSPALRTLADAIYRLADAPSRTGVEAASLEDGLTKLAAGELEPEVLSLTLHRKPELLAASGSRPGFLLHLAGRHAGAQTFTAGGGYEPEVELELSADELAGLARELAPYLRSSWPANLWAPDYNDLAIELLDRRVSVQARAFSGMTPTTQGEAQREFEAVASVLTRLAEHVVRDGRAARENESAALLRSSG